MSEPQSLYDRLQDARRRLKQQRDALARLRAREASLTRGLAGLVGWASGSRQARLDVTREQIGTTEARIDELRVAIEPLRAQAELPRDEQRFAAPPLPPPGSPATVLGAFAVAELTRYLEAVESGRWLACIGSAYVGTAQAHQARAANAMMSQARADEAVERFVASVPGAPEAADPAQHPGRQRLRLRVDAQPGLAGAPQPRRAARADGAGRACLRRRMTHGGQRRGTTSTRP